MNAVPKLVDELLVPVELLLAQDMEHEMKSLMPERLQDDLFRVFFIRLLELDQSLIWRTPAKGVFTPSEVASHNDPNFIPKKHEPGRDFPH